MKTETETGKRAPRPPGPPSAREGAFARRQPLPRGGGYRAKRVVLGRAIPTAHLVHERLGKPTALAVFSSDALSSVAYATEEMLIVLVPLFGIAAFSLIMPISGVIVLVLVALMFSYRQTIKAYPSAGGAYIVTKDNFGLLPAQVAGVALLTDYVLTVAVSVSAGVAAIISAAGGLAPYRVPMAVAFILLIALGNLRGVKDSGRIFAAPTYLFILGIVSLLAIGAVKLFSGGLSPIDPAAVHAANVGVTGALVGGAAIFAVLHAMASGSAAMTGVEAISNGVPAFRRPEWRNARTTLTVMGVTLAVMFLGITFLAHEMRVVPGSQGPKTVLAMIAGGLYGSSGFGHLAFLFLQVATMAILVLAANTAFADFPRLANFHADDAFLPRQFTTRGHRLVFSNGILALAGAATLLVVAFGADVTRLIPFYAIGVFTSFTLSQAGMAKRHLRLREPRWKLGLVINGIGASATGLVLIVIAVTKFTHGAWAVMVLVPLMVWLLVRMNHQYEREHAELRADLERRTYQRPRRPVAVVLVDELDRKTVHAIQYAKTIRAEETYALHLEHDPALTAELKRRWATFGLRDIPLRIVRGAPDTASAVAGFVGALDEDVDVNVIVPGPARLSMFERLRGGRTGARLTRSLLPFEHVRTTLVRDHVGPGHPITVTEDGGERIRVVPRSDHRVVVLVDRVDRAVIRALRYALSLGATEVRALHAGVDPDRQPALIEEWMNLQIPVPLDILECWDRNVPRCLETRVSELMTGTAEVTVVMPRRDFPHLRQRILHDRTSRGIARALGRYEHVDLTVVPYYFAPRRRSIRRNRDQLQATGRGDPNGDGPRTRRDGERGSERPARTEA
jgi:amino acid transporter